MVRHVETLEEFNAILKEAGDKLVVVDFTASWCGPCKQIGPHFDELSNKAENKNVIFLKVDVDEAQDVAAKWDIGAMPTFIFIKNEKKVTEVVGADPGKLGKKLQELRT
uniref:thioredoxin isoform X2 n=1 Tax=Epinephelus lanceolatus TaxID=310571 RepID=UPI0014450E3E|nr:thioredoxin isoform X2 [Epinephelus lanceolatus]